MWQAAQSICPRITGEECLLIPVGPRVIDLNGLAVLNPTGRCVWELLDGRHTVRDMAEALSRQFSVERDQAERDVAEFLSELARLGLAVSDGAPG